MTGAAVFLAVAPNGARKTEADHPALPITPEALARTAAACAEAGAAMIHLHVRDAAKKHSLDVEAYRAATEAIRREVGERIVVQATSESVGLYGPEQQMQMVRDLRPEAVSLAVREIVPDQASEPAAADFLAWVDREGILPQFILYSAEDLARFDDLIGRGVVPAGRDGRRFVLFVLGRYAKDQQSSPLDLLPFVAANEKGRRHPWAVCAFGSRETACVVTAAGLGGHGRIGFENNMLLPDGSRAADNAALVAATAAGLGAIGLSCADAEEARRIMSPA